MVVVEVAIAGVLALLLLDLGIERGIEKVRVDISILVDNWQDMLL